MLARHLVQSGTGHTLEIIMSLCDTCKDPGVCCKYFYLVDTAGEHSRTFWLYGAQTVYTFLEKHNLPFIPTLSSKYKTPEKEEYASYSFSCSALTVEGRCSIYLSRPQICKDLEAGGSNPLCVHSTNRN